MSDNHYDVIVVGGGAMGLAQILALTGFQRGLKVALLDRRPMVVPNDARAFAISAAVRRAFEALGVWAAMAGEAQPVQAMKITDSGTGDISRPQFLGFEGEVAPGEPFAHLVPNRSMTAALLEAARARAEFIAPAEISGLETDGPLARAKLTDGRVFSAPLIVAADGAQSALRKMAGIETVLHDYRQVGIVTTIRHELPHEGVAMQHFRPAGPFASLPLKSGPEWGGNRSSLVWTETPEMAAELKALPPEEAAVRIEAAMGSSFGAVSVAEPLQSFPLRLQLAKRFVGERLALIGDAAHVVHPLAGQGLNLGMKDVAALSETVIEAMRLGRDPGAADVLESYERWRRFDTALMSAVTDALNRLFSNDIAPVRALRDFGLGLVDRLPPVKAALIGRAAGLDRNSPKLLSGMPL
ncbi:MAG: FAD-dependent monooxygenase [Devosia sp.]